MFLRFAARKQFAFHHVMIQYDVRTVLPWNRTTVQHILVFSAHAFVSGAMVSREAKLGTGGGLERFHPYQRCGPTSAYRMIFTTTHVGE
ncbi:MAG: hypothetical protein GEU95_01525 [Rhizobiales bacterium]|nr:hypothetical protein [Hyphomicrobiales bacterium]